MRQSITFKAFPHSGNSLHIKLNDKEISYLPREKDPCFPCIGILRFQKGLSQREYVQHLSLIRASSSFIPITRSQYKRPLQQSSFRSVPLEWKVKSILPYSQVITMHLCPLNHAEKWGGWLLWCEQWMHHFRSVGTDKLKFQKQNVP